MEQREITMLYPTIIFTSDLNKLSTFISNNFGTRTKEYKNSVRRNGAIEGIFFEIELDRIYDFIQDEKIEDKTDLSWYNRIPKDKSEDGESFWVTDDNNDDYDDYDYDDEYDY